MTVTVYKKTGAGLEKVSGVVDTPVTFGDYLDERLDEGYITIYRSDEPLFHPDTELRIEITEGETTTRRYMLVSSDTSDEAPNGSGLYTHRINLIERTKRLEGIICNSITFTNATKQAVSGGIEQAAYTSYYANVPSAVNYIPLSDYSANQITLTSPRSRTNGVVQLPSIADVAASFIEFRRTGTPEDTLSAEVLINYGGEVDTRKSCVVVDGKVIYECNTVADLSVSPTFSTTLPFVNVQYLFGCNLPTGTVFTATCSAVAYDVGITEQAEKPKRYTALSVCNRILRLAEPLRGNEEPRYTIDPAQADWLDDIATPEFTMTQCTLREQLRVVGGFIHAEPRLMEPVMVNGKEMNYIHFDRFGDADTVAVRSDYETEQRTQQINEYCTDLDTTAANLVNSVDYGRGTIAEPDGRHFKSIRTESVNVRIDESNGLIATQFPVREVKELIVVYAKGDAAPAEYDITPFLFEQAEYTANLSSYSGAYPYSKAYAVYYTQGARNIRGLFFKVENAVSPAFSYYAIMNIIAAASGDTPANVTKKYTAVYPSLRFKVTYVPIYSARFSAGKQLVDGRDKFTRIYNQSENLIEARYYGENVKGTAERMGNPEISRTYRYKTLAAIPKAGKTVRFPDGDYMVAAVKTELHQDFISATVEYSKDFNRLSQYIGIQSTKRVYEISEKEAYRRSVLLNDYYMIGHGADTMTIDSGLFVQSCIPVLAAFFPSCVEAPQGERYAGTHPITAVNAFGSADGTESSALQAVTLPVVSSVFGNSIVFSWEYKDNYSAGEKSVYIERGEVKGWWQQDVAYCDFFGRIPFYRFNLLPQDKVVQEDSTEFPQADIIPAGDYGMNIVSKQYYRMEKDSREGIAVNLQIDFRTDSPNLVIGPGIALSSAWVTEVDTDYQAEAFALAEPLNKFAAKYISETEGFPLDSGSFSFVSGDYAAKITLPAELNAAKAWVIASYANPLTETVTDESGNLVQQTTYRGGDVILSCPDNAALRAEFGITDNKTPFTFYIYPTRKPRPYKTT